MAAPALILVRHGRPKIDPDTSPTIWPLCPEGREACVKLAERIAAFAPTAIVSSPETKALETAGVIAERTGLKVEIDPELHEHKRQHRSFGSEAEFRARIAEVFTNPAAAGGETPGAACERLAAALARRGGHPLVAVTHGAILSFYLAGRLGVDAHDLWRGLRLPDAFVLDADGGLIERLG